MKIKLNKTNIDDFLIEIQNEEKYLKKRISIEEEKESVTCKSYADLSSVLEDEKFLELREKISEQKEDIKSNIVNLQKLEKQLDLIEENCEQVIERKSRHQNFYEMLEDITVKYSEYLDEKQKNEAKIIEEMGKLQSLNLEIILMLKNMAVAKNERVVNIEPEVSEEKESEQKEKRVLCISELTGKIILPYKLSEVENVLLPGQSVEEVISNQYTLEIKDFKNSTKSRFREAYNLVKQRCGGSTIKATELGIELMFNYKLNPAVIAACRNEDELDIYLDCLESDELDSFDIFEIKYEIAPSVIPENEAHGRRKSVE